MKTILKQKEESLQGCTKCGLCQSAKQPVPGMLIETEAKPIVMFIGEAPGETEDRIRKPFVGRAGLVLQKLIIDSHIDYSLYITNTVKCRPPNNRKPQLIEADMCFDTHLVEEIEAVDPKYIVCLGRTAAETLLRQIDEPTNGTLRGRRFTYDKWPVVATWHPAACLYDDGDKKQEEIKRDIRTLYLDDCALLDTIF